MSYLQFWMAINGLRNQLQPDDGERRSAELDWDSIFEDIQSLYTEYFSPNEKGRLSLSEDIYRRIDNLMHDAHYGTDADKAGVIPLLETMFEAQDQVYGILLREDYHNFTRSGIYMKLTTHLTRAKDSEGDPGSITEPEFGRPQRSLDLQPSMTLSADELDEEVQTSKRQQESLSRKKSLIDVFKRGKRKAKKSGSISPAEDLYAPPASPLSPKRMDTSENLEQELHSILEGDEKAFGLFRGRTKSKSKGKSRRARSFDDLGSTSGLEAIGENDRDARNGLGDAKFAKFSDKLTALFRNSSFDKLASSDPPVGTSTRRTKSQSTLSSGTAPLNDEFEKVGSTTSDEDDDDEEEEEEEDDEFLDANTSYPSSLHHTPPPTMHSPHDSQDPPTLLSVLGMPKVLMDVYNRIQRLTDEENNIQQQIEQAEKEGWPSDRLRELELIKMGIGALLREAREEMKKMEEVEVRDFIMPVGVLFSAFNIIFPRILTYISDRTVPKPQSSMSASSTPIPKNMQFITSRQRASLELQRRQCPLHKYGPLADGTPNSLHCISCSSPSFLTCNGSSFQVKC